MTARQQIHARTAGETGAGSSATGGALRLSGVHKRFGEHTAIDRVDLDIRAGEFLSLLGPSGCGKTTLLRMIGGFEDPTSGAIALDGDDLTGLPPFRRPVNTVFQSYALFPHYTVAENVAYGLKRAKVPRKELAPRVAEALDLVQMRRFADRRPDMLSGGQQQRVALARALVNRPRVLLLDEPMSALDRKLREEMQLELIRLHTDLGLTFVFVTHDQEEALAMSDRIVVMSEGRIQQVGSAEEVYGSPANAFVAGFIGKQNFVDAEVVEAYAEGLLLRGPRCDLRATAAGFAAGAQVRAAIRPESMGIRPATEGAPGGLNAVAGRVVGESFLGDVVQYLVRAADGHELLSRVRTSAAPDVHEGDDVVLTWEAAAVQVFSHE
ncbi:ABC transporter ATP-binding protein [Brevibacterium album]|uniref:ABC transporter ATP-binding protein n=1 Tax=Brevibacterium album TaxID=417948 RepID=UPI00040C0461|nr:ABC transporter ATP-binding protein [Brevibacterium album]